MKIISASLLTLFLLFNSFCFSQKEDTISSKKKTKFQIGLYLGSCLANKYTAKLYDGYGYDAEGKKNVFKNSSNMDQSSFMFRKIVMEYGGGYGQTDQIAIALGVNPGEWTFDESDMPLNMKYSPAFMVGTQMSFVATKKDALFINANVAKLSLNGNFTIVITTPSIGPQPPGYQNIKTFSITGSEQRMILQAGYRRIMGDDEVLNFFIEGGPTLNMTKYIRNQISINNLQIDLASYYTQNYYATYRAKYIRGIGLGAFAGLGANITANPNWTLQILYSPSYEKINIGESPKLRLQHAIGLRAFYNL
jgi:hypothetical protein